MRDDCVVGESWGHKYGSWSRVNCFLRRIADIARASTLGEYWRRCASFSASELGSDCLQRLKTSSACDRCSFDVDIRWEIRVSNGAGSGPSIAANCDCWSCGSIDDAAADENSRVLD